MILDFFAVSGTTAHAVLELNEEDGGSRRFIVCTNNENNILITEYIYTSYQNYDFLDLFQTQESYKNHVNDFNQENKIHDIQNTVFKDYDSYLKAIGTGLDDMIIVC